MEGDGFSDPRRRAARRPRGGARGRGRGQQYSRGSQKRATTNSRPRAAPNLGSNEYRFRPIGDQEDNAYDAGVDFHDAASQPVYDPASNEDLADGVNLSKELSADFSKLETVLASVPLWVRLGEHARFALGVPDEDKIENYLDPIPSEHAITDELNTSKNESTEEFLKDLAGLSFDDYLTTEEAPSRIEANKSSETNAHKVEDGKACISTARKASQKLPSSQPEEPDEPDDLDKWLDEI